MSHDQSVSAPRLQDQPSVATPVHIASRLLNFLATADETLRNQLYGRMHCATSAAAPEQIEPALP
jgi:hypothetical protein